MHQCNTLSELMGSTQAVISDFEWLKHCRVYWRSQDCIVSAGKSDIKYCHEYVGCTDRLVITPLTERCYVSISRALGLCLGGAFLGPSGAGKTEIVKDLGRTMGQYIITVSCSDRHRSHSICTILKGLCCTGAWCCFEDFDRMEPTILSVIAEQMMAITHAKRAARNTLVLPGYDHGELPLHHQMGYFVTMNPQMRQFTSLPENLKVRYDSFFLRDIPEKASDAFTHCRPSSEKWQ
jgi:dynein heavy chain